MKSELLQPDDAPLRHDLPTEADRRRMRNARACAHRRVDVIETVMRRMMDSAFREEMGATVRSASPFLIALLDHDGIALDDAVQLIEPQRGWPNHPQLGGVANARASQHVVRHYVASLLPKAKMASPYRARAHGFVFERADDDWLRIEVAGHSLEATARIGPVRFETRFCELRVELDGELPESLAIGCIGRPIEQVVDHPTLRGRGWLIKAVEDAALPFVGPVIVVPNGAVAYRVPWAR